MKKMTLWMMVAVAGMQVQAADILIDENFDSRDVGEVYGPRDIGAASIRNDTSKTEFAVVNDSGADNSLRIYDNDTSTTPYVQYGLRRALERGVLSFDFKMAEFGNQNFMVTLQQAGTIGVYVVIRSGKIQVSDGGEWIYLDDSNVSYDVWHSVEITFDASGNEDTFSVKLNGNPLSCGGDSVVSFHQNLSSGVNVTLWRGSGTSITWTSDTSIDNIKMTAVSE